MTQPATVPAIALADDRIPFPRTTAALACRSQPDLFAIEDIPNRTEYHRAMKDAKRACSGCPIVEACLKWALANPNLTQRGVWAATTGLERRRLRRRLTERLGTDWITVVADRDRRRDQRRRDARYAPPTVRAHALASLELELIPTRTAPYEPWKEPLTPARQAHNRVVLEAALKAA